MTPRTLNALAREGLAVERAVPLSKRGGVFKLDLADGRRATLRTFETSVAAREVWRLLKAAQGGAVPSPWLLFTRHLVIEYVEGARLDRYLRWSGAADVARQVRAAAAVLAELHRVRVPRTRVQDLSEYKRVLTRMTRRAVRHGMLDAAVAERLAAIASPETMTLACTHGDLSPQNLVIRTDGNLCAIDIERLAVRDVAFDLARAVQLWPLSKARERTLLDAYAAAGGRPESYLEHRTFWTAVALSTSLSFRWKFRPRDVPPLLRRLRALATTRTRGRAA